jgi:hypothetical protein
MDASGLGGGSTRVATRRESRTCTYLQHTANGQDARYTRQQAIAELEALRASGAFTETRSLLGKYDNLGSNPTFDELQATLREASTEWQSELDEFLNED